MKFGADNCRVAAAGGREGGDFWSERRGEEGTDQDAAQRHQGNSPGSDHVPGELPGSESADKKTTKNADELNRPDAV